MAKLELNPLSSGYNINTANVNFQKIEDELKNKVVYRDEASPMLRDLDLNNKRIVNLADGTDNSHAVSFGQIQAIIAENAENLNIDPLIRDELSATDGSTLVGFVQEGAGAIATTVEEKLREWVSDADYSSAALAIAYAVANGKQVLFGNDATITVPTDVATLQDAIDAVQARPGVTVTINIATGHALTAGFRITNRDCSFIRITSTDATVTVNPAFTFVANSDLSSDVPRSSLIGFLAVRSKMPTWEILVDMTGVSCVTGFELDYASDGAVLPGCGVINTAWAGGVGGVNCRITTGSRLQGGSSVWTGAEAGNVAVSHNSFANLQTANMSNTAVEACLDVSRGSVVHALGADCSNGAYAGIYSRRSFVSAQGVDVSNCGVGVWGAAGSFVGCNESTFDGCTVDVSCDAGSFVGLGRSTKSGADLNPANSSVQGATSGTAAPRSFNIAGGYGLISYSNHLPGNVEHLSANSGAQTVASGSAVAVASLTYTTALSLSGKRMVRGGSIYGANVGVRITIDGTVVLTDNAQAVGDDSTGETFSVVSIPPCKCESSILIEAYNRDGSVSRDIGWKIYHTASL